MVVLFCNERYGAPFERAARAWAARRCEPLMVVHSASRLRHSRWPRRLLVQSVRTARQLTDRAAGSRVRTLTVTDVNAQPFRRRLAGARHGIIAGFDQIFQAALIERFETLVNFHPSLLPLYRGPVPSHWCLENGERASGYTVHRVTEAIDAGEILHQEVVAIDGADDPHVLDQRIAGRGATFLETYLDHLIGRTDIVPQRVDAYAVYQHHVGYRSFPARRQPAA